VGFLDELVKYKPRRKKHNPSSSYPVYIDDVHVGEFVVPPLPWWAMVLIVVGGVAGVASLLKKLKRR